MSEKRPSTTPEEFADAFRRTMEWAGVHTGEKSPFRSMLTDHFGADPATFPVTRESIAIYDLPNLQLALDAYLDSDGRDHQLVGFGGHVVLAEMGLSGLVHDRGFGLAVGPVRRSLVALERGSSVTCVTTGLFLIADGDDRIAVLVLQGERGLGGPGLKLEVLAPAQDLGERFIAELRALMRDHNVFRGKVLALNGGDEMMGGSGLTVEFLSFDPVSRDRIVLPDGVLDTIELHTVEFARHAEALQRAGMHLRRGLLLHGPPGTGKTLTTTHLISRLQGRTVVVLTGSALGLISDACAIARNLQPAMVVLEDVDLVAQERTAMGFGATSLLFSLLNEMDGIGEDADVVFVMTTNRADLLEPALAARPGRIDQAVAFPLPDAAARARLLEVFCRDLEVDLSERDALIESTGAVSPAFLRELVRKAALYAAQAGASRVDDTHFRSALDLLASGGSITRVMLGGDGGQGLEELEESDDWDEDEELD